MPSEYIRTRGVVNKRGRGKARGGVVNRRGRRKVRVVTALVSPVMGRAGCPGREQDCLKPTGAGVGVSARIYNSNSLGDRAREGRGIECRHAGTVEAISARIHVVISHGDRAEEGRRSNRRHSANALWEREDSCMSMGASIVVAGVGVGGVLSSSSDVSIWAKLDIPLPLPTRLLCLVLAIFPVHLSNMCTCVCAPIYALQVCISMMEVININKYKQNCQVQY